MDEFFNHRYAAKIEKQFAAFDPGTAAALATMVVHDVLYQHIDENQRIVKSRAAEVLDSIRDDIAKSLAKNPEEDEAVEIAKMVGVISKTKENFDVGAAFQVSKADYGQHEGKKFWNRRDEGGKFTAGAKAAGKGAQAAGKGASEFESRWNAPTKAGTNDRTYNRIAAGGKLLGDVSAATGHEDAAMVARGVGQFAGSFGPSAERVMGPAIQRTAYRYRGTERGVDSKLEALSNRATSGVARDEGLKVQNVTPEMKTEASRMAAAQYLMGRLPDKRLSDLQLASGRVPPSEGVLISADGNVTRQALGYQEDHFVPFNLRNLKDLKGGSYVRSRSAGGLTTEDLYTGLMGGARSVTVVSRSGIYTVDFDESLRGGRRYNDKARQMVKQYGKILDAVQSETVSRQNLDIGTKASIRAEVESEFQGMGSSARQLIESEIKNREKLHQSPDFISPEELEEIDEKALAAAGDPNLRSSSYIGSGPNQDGNRKMPDDPEKRYQIFRTEMIGDLLDSKEQRMHRLDSDGYATALDALAEQFPYYLSVRHKTQRDGAASSRETDSGYVAPKHNRPSRAREGYFNERVEGRGKYPASTTRHQNRANAPGRDEVPSSQEQSAEGTGSTTAPPAGAQQGAQQAPMSPKKMAQQASRQGLVNNAFSELAIFASQHGESPALSELDSEIRSMEPAEKLAHTRMKLNNKVWADKVDTELKEHSDELISHLRIRDEKNGTNLVGQLNGLASAYRTASSTLSSEPLPKGYERSPQSPATFPEYEQNMSPEQAQAAWSQLTSRNPHAANASDIELREASDVLLHAAKKMESGDFSDAAKQEVLTMFSTANMGEDALTESLSAMYMAQDNPQVAQGLAQRFRENSLQMEKMRSLKRKMSEMPAEAQPAQSPPPSEPSQTALDAEPVSRQESRQATQQVMSNENLVDSLGRLSESRPEIADNVKQMVYGISNSNPRQVFRAYHQIPEDHKPWVRGLMKMSEFSDIDTDD